MRKYIIFLYFLMISVTFSKVIKLEGKTRNYSYDYIEENNKGLFKIYDLSGPIISYPIENKKINGKVIYRLNPNDKSDIITINYVNSVPDKFVTINQVKYKAIRTIFGFNVLINNKNYLLQSMADKVLEILKYNTNDNILKTFKDKKNRICKLYSDEILQCYSPNGDYEKTKYINGEKEGLAVLYTKDDYLLAQYNYVNGNIEGKYKEYLPSSVVKEYDYLNGKTTKNYTLFLGDGSYEKHIFKNNQEIIEGEDKQSAIKYKVVPKKDGEIFSFNAKNVFYEYNIEDRILNGKFTIISDGRKIVTNINNDTLDKEAIVYKGNKEYRAKIYIQKSKYIVKYLNAELEFPVYYNILNYELSEY